MSENTEKQTLLEVLETIKIKHLLEAETNEKLAKVFGTRWENALEAINCTKVKKIVFVPSNRIVWLVSGKERDYLILPNAGYCSCEDFYFRVISHEEYLCYHLLAQRLAEGIGCYPTVSEDDITYDKIVFEIARKGEKTRKLPIQDVENIRRVATGILAEEESLILERLLDAVHEAGFPELTKKHLVVILNTDKAKRFYSLEGCWNLRDKSKS